MDLSEEEIGRRFRNDPTRHPITGSRLIKGRGPYNKLVKIYGLDAPREKSVIKPPRDPRYDRFREIYKKARNQSGPKCDLLALMGKLAGHNWDRPEFEREFEDRIGPYGPAYLEIQKISNSKKFNPPVDGRIIGEYEKYFLNESTEVDYEKLTEELINYIEEKERRSTYFNIMCFLIDEAIKYNSSRHQFSPSKKIDLKSIEDDAERFHNPDLVKESRVYHLYNTGEFTNQKGGDIYQQRSEFTTKPEILEYSDVNLNFPVKRNGQSFAILTEEDGKKIRKKMLEFID